VFFRADLAETYLTSILPFAVCPEPGSSWRLHM